MKTLLLVDDEARMLDLLNIYLSPVYHCIKVNSGHEAVVHMKNLYADLILLDVMMPEMDGWSACAKIREFSKVPIIMLTARNEKSDVVKGFQLGADDYVTKPFDEGELLARIDALFRRMDDKDPKAVHFKGLKWDEESHELTYEKQQIQLTPKEFSLLGILLKNPNKVFSRAHLLESIWENKAFTEDRTIDSHVRNIRDKLRQAKFPVDLYLSTVWGVGYKWVPKE
ncbi:response regulator transcription factor [Bacillus sp. ISL-4]|uniref:response regulator transcription factor n=1 Tax=Bacillus sp. ISL-4 TaxID=2819125 RepID=UPI001BE8314D|nr:response regulator transcription factor [Bacillus sp. ISL-4]MBT2668914.1 response regulator transcription factor [Bacillus sp. ISL-4]MBT2671260.1 response regulator transcription factor [Streptomyces sp. ISL-14]